MAFLLWVSRLASAFSAFRIVVFLSVSVLSHTAHIGILFLLPPAATLLSVIPQHTGPHLCKSFSAFYLFQEWFVRRRIPDPCRSCPLPASPFFPRPPYEQEIFPPRIKKSTKLSFSPLHTDNLCAIITFVCLYGVALALHIEPSVPCDSRTTALPAHAYH